MKKYILLACFGLFLFSSCASSRVHISVDGSFSKKRWLSNRVGVMPALSSAQAINNIVLQNSYLKSALNIHSKSDFRYGRHKINSVFAKMLRKQFPLEPPDITPYWAIVSLMGKYNLIETYTKIDSQYKSLRYIDKKRLFQIGERLKLRYLILPILLGQSASGYRYKDSDQVMYAANLVLQIWDVKKKKLVFLGKARGTDTTGNLLLELLMPKVSWTSMESAYVDGFEKILKGLRWGDGNVASSADKGPKFTNKTEEYYFGRD